MPTDLAALPDMTDEPRIDQRMLRVLVEPNNGLGRAPGAAA